MEKDKRLMEASWWERLTVGKTPSCSDGWGCVSSLLLDLRPNYGRGNEDNGTYYKRSHACTATLSAPTLQRRPLTHASPETPWHSRASLAQSRVGHCSFLLGPGAHKVLYVPSKGLFPQARVSSGSSLVRLMVTSSKRSCAIPRSDAPRASAPMAGPSDPYLPRRHSEAGLAQSLWDLLLHTSFCFSPLSVSGGYGISS